MKFLFKVIVLPILTIVAIPVIVLAVLYKSVDIPVDDFTSTTETVALMDMVKTEMDAFLEAPETTSTISLGVAQKDANLLIKEQFLSMNASYLDDDADDADKNYVLKEELYGYQGSWVRFEEDIVEIESGVHIFVSDFTYKTRLLIAFKLEVDTEEVVLTLDKLTLGNLPLEWAFGVADWAVESVTGNDIGTTINDQLGGMAEFDVATREIRMNVQDLVDAQMEDNPDQAALVNSLMAFVDQNQLFSIGFNSGSFDAELNIGKLVDDSEPFVLDGLDRITTEGDLTAILENKATTLILSTLSTTSSPYIEFSDFTLNRVLDYMLKDQQVSPGVIQSEVLFESYMMEVSVPYITMENDTFVVEIPLSITSIDEPTHIFKTIIKIDANPTMNGSDLVIELNSLTAGEVSLTNEHLANILVLLGDVSFIEDGNLVIKDFDAQMNQAGMSIESVSLVNDKLRLYVGLDAAIPLGDLQDEIETVLEGLESNPDIPVEVTDAIDDILNGADPEQAIEDFMDVFDGLSDEDQQELFDSVVDGMDGSDYSLEDILGLLG